jgi:hypothetical protein
MSTFRLGDHQPAPTVPNVLISKSTLLDVLCTAHHEAEQHQHLTMLDAFLEAIMQGKPGIMNHRQKVILYKCIGIDALANRGKRPLDIADRINNCIVWCNEEYGRVKQ